MGAFQRPVVQYSLARAIAASFDIAATSRSGSPIVLISRCTRAAGIVSRRWTSHPPGAAAQLDALEHSADDQTWEVICDVLDLIDQHADSTEARREEITGSNGKRMWKVPVRSQTVDALAVLWSRSEGSDYVVFVGVMPIAR